MVIGSQEELRPNCGVLVQEAPTRQQLSRGQGMASWGRISVGSLVLGEDRDEGE